QLMDAARALAKRICLVPEPSVRLNKAITMMGMQAAGVYYGLLLEGASARWRTRPTMSSAKSCSKPSASTGSKAISRCATARFSPSPWDHGRPRDNGRRRRNDFLAGAGNCVTRGLDPRVHHLRKKFCEEDGLPDLDPAMTHRGFSKAKRASRQLRRPRRQAA